MAFAEVCWRYSCCFRKEPGKVSVIFKSEFLSYFLYAFTGIYQAPFGSCHNFILYVLADTDWLMLPLLGWLLMWISREKKPEGEVRTFVDRVIGNVWTVMGLSAWFVSMLALFTPMRLPILFIILLIMGMGTTVTGLIIRFTPTAVGGVAAIILAPFTLIAGNMWQPLLFIAGFVVMMIVPGHILNYKSNHPAR